MAKAKIVKVLLKPQLNPYGERDWYLYTLDSKYLFAAYCDDILEVLGEKRNSQVSGFVLTISTKRTPQSLIIRLIGDPCEPTRAYYLPSKIGTSVSAKILKNFWRKLGNKLHAFLQEKLGLTIFVGRTTYLYVTHKKLPGKKEQEKRRVRT